MRVLVSLLVVLIVALGVFGGGMVYFALRLTPEVVSLNQEAAKMQAETALMQAKESYLQTQLAAKLRLQDLTATQEAKATALYTYSLAAGYAVRELWLVWLMLSVAGVCYQQRARFEKQVPFKYDGIESVIPAKASVALTEKAIRAKELEISQKMLTADADAQRDRFKDTVSAIKTVKGMMPKAPAAPLIDMTPPAALPVHSQGRYLVTELLTDPDLEPDRLPLGRTVSPGQLIQGKPADLTCIDIIGKQNFCKTGILKMLTLGLFRLQDQGIPVDLYAFDCHAGWPDSFELFLRPALGRFKRCVLGAAAFERGEHVQALTEVVAELDARQQTGKDTPLIVLLIDEIQDVFDYEEYAKATYKALKKIRRARKGGVLEICIWHDSTKEGTGVGTGLMSLNVSAFVVNCGRTKAERVLESGDAMQAVNLERGLAVLKLSGLDSELVQLPYFDKADTITQYYIGLLPQPQPNAQEAPGTTNAAASEESPAFDLKTLREAAKMSQNQLAKLTGIAQAKLSRVEAGTSTLSAQELLTIHEVLTSETEGNAKKIIQLNSYRQA
jgi:DNA-binding transcriptional regulator YiaG